MIVSGELKKGREGGGGLDGGQGVYEKMSEEGEQVK